MNPQLQGLLIRVPAEISPSLTAGKSFRRLAGTKFELEPLFKTAAAQKTSLASPEREWFVARPTGTVNNDTPWDVIHEAMTSLEKGPGIADGVLPDAIEPDLLQSWLPVKPEPSRLAAAADHCVFVDQVEDLPKRRGEFAWHLGDSFSQLERAGEHIKSSASDVRIVHLDTGYDPEHVTTPGERVIRALERNFIDGNDPQSAVDPGRSGALRNPGHGTATLALLAGGKVQIHEGGYRFDSELGGAPRARVIPVRVGNSVVQLTTSSVARGVNYAAELCKNEKTRVHVISMSMGGVASDAWADAVNKAYEAGIVFVAAAGNNFSSGAFAFPTHQIVYPARFRRVIAACGVMADRRPYFGLSFGTMQGNWGPSSSMATAISAFTPNVPWARIGCKKTICMDGAGTSSATPQIAAAAALYLQLHGAELFSKKNYPEHWMRVEAVRKALFLSADKSADAGSTAKLGNGILRAQDMLDRSPAPVSTLTKTRPDSAGFPFLNVLSRRGIIESPQDRILQLEATQLIHLWRNAGLENPLERAVDDPDGRADDVMADQVQAFMEVISHHKQASSALKARAVEYLDSTSAKRKKASGRQRPKPQRVQIHRPEVSTFVPPIPSYRDLKGYTVDPSLSTSLDTHGISEVTFHVPWEPLQPGPIGEYIEVVDVDPASHCAYEPVHLDDPALLAQDGLRPSEGDPQFHQQMVYAVCSLTIVNFEKALGRKALWRPGPPPRGRHPKDDSHFVRRLRVYPHALREANAFYSPAKVALLFGYFNATTDDPQRQLPAGRVFTCLSHDIIAHEITHALLDGMHRQYLLPSNRDVYAFHEAFADIVAMLQHFTFPELVAHQIASTQGGIQSKENLLVQLASQFGQATGKRMALRDALGQVDGDDDVWRLREPDPKEYETVDEAHPRGRILVSAVFDAFLSIYQRRTADLIRLATDGSGILNPGAIHPDLAARLAEQATKSAHHVLTMCIRALDYCPPTDITFGEYLRAIITADHDLVPNDEWGYRIAFMEAFRKRGIFPPGVRTFSLDSLLWRKPEQDYPQPSIELLDRMKSVRDAVPWELFAASREEIFHLQRKLRGELHWRLNRHFRESKFGKQDAQFLGLNPDQRSFEVHAARIAFRISPDGQPFPQFLMTLLQRTSMPVNPDDPNGEKMSFEGGSTILADLKANKVSYCIRKNLGSRSRLTQQRELAVREFDSPRATYLGIRPLSNDPKQLSDEPFALLHRGH